MRRMLPGKDVASAATVHDGVYPRIAIEQVLGFDPDQERNQRPDLVQLNCPDTILTAFRALLEGTAILGSSWTNPYTREEETIPLHVAELTSRHLQILARNEQVNTTGVMKLHLYQGLLNADQVARLRCLVKATTIAGTATVVASGGYGAPRIPFVSPQRMIIIDQAGLQWQGDLKNTGGMFIYPSGAFAPHYQTWQRDMFQVMYGYPRPAMPSANSVSVEWLGGDGRFDLNLVTDAIKVEFSQAFDAAVSQGDLTLAADEMIHFRFLKAGMGFFASGLSRFEFVKLELARLVGIEKALQQMAALPFAERQIHLGKIRSIELPFSGECRGFAIAPPEITQTLERIKAIVEQQLGLVWAGAGRTDALAPKPGFVIATTNCGDPHALIGNEGGYSSVDAAIASNAWVNHLNPGFNQHIQRRSSPNFYPAVPVIPSVAQGEGSVLAPASTLSAFASLLSRMGIIPRPQPAAAYEFSNQAILKQVTLHFCRELGRGNWLQLNSSPLLEVGISNYSGNRALATANFQVEWRGTDCVFLNKQARYQEIHDERQKQDVLTQFLSHIPQNIRDIVLQELQEEAQRRATGLHVNR